MHEWFLKNSFDAGALPASAFVDSSCEPPLSEATLYRWLITLQYAHAQRPPHQRLRSSRHYGKCTGSDASDPFGFHYTGSMPISMLVDSLERVSGFRKNIPFLSDTLNGLLVVDKTGLPDTNCLIAIPSAGTPCAPLFNYFLEYVIDESFFTRNG